MAEKKLSRMTYLGGHSGRKGLLGLLAFPEEFPSGIEFTVFYMALNDQWGQRQFDFDVASVTYGADSKGSGRAWWLVGKRGEVVEAGAGNPIVRNIATAGTGPGKKYGYLAQVRTIGGHMFICGYRRQVYQYDAGDWKLISASILDNRKKGPWNGFESIDGVSADNLYAVGDEGEIWHYDGARWQQSESPTNRNLADVRCIDGTMWACGDGGIVLRGDKTGWDVLWSDPDPSESWWSVEGFGGEIYLAGDSYLGILRGTVVDPVDVGIPGKVTTGTLHASEGILWSIGEAHVLSFDGKKWRQHVCPENR